MPQTIYSLCDRSMVALTPWAASGWPCVAVDIEPPLGEPPLGIRHVQASLLDLTHLDDPAFVMGWPPCTHLCGSGARWWAAKGPGKLAEALALVAAVRRLAGAAPLIVENPVGRLSANWRKPDVIVQPWHFAGWSADPVADAYRKTTCLWLENGAQAPTPHPWDGPVDTERITHVPPSPERAMIRSVSPKGLGVGILRANEALVYARSFPATAGPLPP